MTTQPNSPEPPAPSGLPRMVSVEAIRVAPDRRLLRNVPDLAESIRRVGLLHPITVTEDLRLVAGGNRLAACRSLGWDEVPAVVVQLDHLHAALAEIDENLVRNELTALERAEQLARRKEIYEALHPETRSVNAKGGPGRGRKKTAADSAVVFSPGAVSPEVAPFAADTARKTGRSERTVRADLQIARAIPEAVRDKIRVTPLADRKDDLLKLARLDPDRQEAVVEKVLAHPTPLTVPRALREVQRDEKRAALEAKAQAAAVTDPSAPRWEVVEGDCLEVLAGLKPGQARLIFADPPDNSGVNSGGHYDDHRGPEDYLRWCEDWMQACYRVLAEDGAMWVLISDEWADDFGALLRRKIGLHRRSWIKWYATFGVNGANNFNRCSRSLFYMVKDPDRFVFNPDAVTRPSDRRVRYGGKRADPGGKLWDDVWMIPHLTETCAERIHDFPTQLPLALLTPIIGCASEPGDLVLDPFSGSGTTGAAAIPLGRRFLGVELSPTFAGLSRQRLTTAASPESRAAG